MNFAKHAFVCCFHPTTEASKIHDSLLVPYSKNPNILNYFVGTWRYFSDAFQLF